MNELNFSNPKFELMARAYKQNPDDPEITFAFLNIIPGSDCCNWELYRKLLRIRSLYAAFKSIEVDEFLQNCLIQISIDRLKDWDDQYPLMCYLKQILMPHDRVGWQISTKALRFPEFGQDIQMNGEDCASDDFSESLIEALCSSEETYSLFLEVSSKLHLDLKKLIIYTDIYGQKIGHRTVDEINAWYGCYLDEPFTLQSLRQFCYSFRSSLSKKWESERNRSYLAGLRKRYLKKNMLEE